MNSVLIIDDDPKNIFALKATLVARGYEIYSAQSAGEGFNLLEEQTGIGIVLLDMMMPEVDGYEFLHQLRRSDRFGKLPVIALTAQAMTGDREKCLAAGADDYISKPVNVDRLLQILKTTLT